MGLVGKKGGKGQDKEESNTHKGGERNEMEIQGDEWVCGLACKRQVAPRGK